MNQSAILSELGEEIPSYQKNFLNPESCSQSFLKNDKQNVQHYNQFFQTLTLNQQQQSSSQQPSINGEGPRLSGLGRPQLDLNEAIIVNSNQSLNQYQNNNSEINPNQSNPAENLSISYLNISFQEIVNLLLNNESPSLSNSIRCSVRNSSLIVFAFLVFASVELILETLALYGSLQTNPTRINRLMIAYFFLKWMSDALMLYSLLQIRYIINDCAVLGLGEVSNNIVEFLKYIIRNNSPFDEDQFEDDENSQLSQSQWVARSIASKIDTYNWINFLINYQGAHLYSVNRIIFLSQNLLFIWGNAILLQENNLHSFNSVVIFYSLMPGYFGAVAVALSFILVCGSLPIMFFLILCQSLTCVIRWIRNVCYSFRVWTQRRQKQKFLNNLKPISYIELKNVNPLTIEDTCVICLSIYNPHDQVISLPCNVAQSHGRTTTNHFFHAQCIHVWIQEQGNCPVCRKRFIQVDHQEE